MPKNEPARNYLFQRNLILREALIAAPVAVCACSLENALLLCFVFCVVTAFTVLLAALIPQRVPYSFRILSYSLVAALVYIPAALVGSALFPQASAGIYLPVLSVGLLLTSEQDRLFADAVEKRKLRKFQGGEECLLLTLRTAIFQ